MNELIKADIFFFITSIAVVLMTLIVSVVLYYLIKILRDIKYISQKAREESELLAEDLSQLRENIKKEGSKIKHILSFFYGVYSRKKKN